MSKTLVTVLYNGYEMTYLRTHVRGNSNRRVRTAMKALVRQSLADVRNGHTVEVLVPCGSSRGRNYLPYWKDGVWW